MQMPDTEIGGSRAYGHYGTEALLPAEYIYLFTGDLERGSHPHPHDTWALVTGIVRRADNPSLGWVIYTLLPTGEGFLHYRVNPTVIRAAHELDGVPHLFDPSHLSTQVTVETARLKTTQDRIDRLRSLSYLADALEHGRQTNTDRSVQGV